MSQPVRVVRAALACAVLLGCQQEGGFSPVEATSVTLSPSTVTLFITDSVTVSAQVVAGKAVLDSVPVAWSSDNPSIVRVRPRGTQASVEAVAIGAANVIAEYGSLADTLPVTVIGPGSITVTPRSVQLALSADSITGHDQIVDLRADVAAQSGALISAPVRWQFTAGEIAGLDTAAGQDVRVRALGVGTTSLIATAYNLADTVTVSVVPDTRFLTKLLSIVPDSVRTDVHAPVARFPVIEYRAFNGFGDNVCQDVHLDLRADSSVISAVQQLPPPDTTNCKIRITPLGPGQTWLRAAVNDVRDSVLVTVTDIEYSAVFETSPDTTTIRAGDSVQYVVRIKDDGERPVSGLTVNFNLNSDASSQPQVGTLNATSVVTDAQGRATVKWLLPQTAQFFAGGNDRLQLEFAVEVPNGQVATGVARPALLPGPLTAIRFFSTALLTDTIPGGLVDSLGFLNRGYLAQALDRFGNLVNTALSFSVSDPDIGEVQVLEALTGVTVPASAQVVAVQGLRPGSMTLTVRQGTVSRAIPVSVIAGPTVVTTEASATVRVQQISTTFNHVDVYTGGAANDFPTFTQSRDTVAFLLQSGGQWAANVVAADGSMRAAPVALYSAFYTATYAWGFPVFRPSAGKLGDVVFISDSAGLGKSNVFIASRATGTVTRVTSNANPRLRYRGLSLAPDGNRVLVVVDSFNHPTRPDSSIASNVFELNLTTGQFTAITANTLTTGDVYRYAAYSPDGSIVYVDRSGPVITRELLAFHGATFDKFVVQPGQSALFEPTFSPLDGTLIAYLDSGQIKFQSVSGTLIQAGLSSIKSFSWSKR